MLSERNNVLRFSSYKIIESQILHPWMFFTEIIINIKQRDLKFYFLTLFPDVYFLIFSFHGHYVSLFSLLIISCLIYAV